jgi:hypothetical protein
MRESGFPWPWSGSENRRLALLVLAWIAALNLWALFSIHALPLARPSDWDEEVTRRAPLFARYDSGWYNTIAERGYQAPPAPGQQSEHAFFPLYPMTARVLRLATGLDGFRAGLLVSYAALLLAIPLLVEEARERFGAARARAALPFLFVYPVAFFLASVYTESLFLLLALLAFRSVRRGNLPLAIALGLLLGLTRAPAAAVGPALAVAWWLGRREGENRLAGTGLLFFAPLAGVLGWIHALGFAKGEPGLFFRSMGAWRHAAGEPVAGVAAFWQEFSGMLASGWFLENPGAIAPYFHFVLFAVLGVVLLALRRWPDAAWVACALALPVLTGTATGTPRYTLTIYPGHFAAAALCEGRPWLKWPWLGASLFGLLAESALFVNWHFIS